MEKNKTTIIAVITALAVVGYFLLNSSSPAKTESAKEFQNEAAEPAADDSGIQDESAAVTTFTVDGKNFSFSPATINVNKGDRVRIIFKNVEGFHDFIIDEFSAKTKRLKAGEEEIIEFTADKSGTFEYYCSIGTHRAMGMVGSLNVK